MENGVTSWPECFAKYCKCTGVIGLALCARAATKACRAFKSDDVRLQQHSEQGTVYRSWRNKPHIPQACTKHYHLHKKHQLWSRLPQRFDRACRRAGQALTKFTPADLTHRSQCALQPCALGGNYEIPSQLHVFYLRAFLPGPEAYPRACGRTCMETFAVVGHSGAEIDERVAYALAIFVASYS